MLHPLSVEGQACPEDDQQNTYAEVNVHFCYSFVAHLSHSDSYEVANSSKPTLHVYSQGHSLAQRSQDTCNHAIIVPLHVLYIWLRLSAIDQSSICLQTCSS